MEVAVKLATREGAAHVSGILAGFTLLAKRGELTLRVQDERQGSPLAREALLETEIDGRTVVFDLMDGYFYNDPAAVLALFVLCYPRIFAVTFDESFSRATGLKVDTCNTLLAILTALTIVLGMRMMGAMLISSLVIFPAVFSVGIEPSSGPSLVFITLPGIFNSMPLSMVWSSVFFLLLVVAALTSTISLHEVITAYMHEEWHMSRRAAAWSTTGACMALAAVASLSLGVLKGWNIFGLTIFDSLDYLTANILLPAGGFFTCIFVGWRLDRKILKAEISNNGTLKFRIYGVFIFLVRYVCPAVLLLIFLDNLGLF